MGVRGLTTYINSNSNIFLKDYHLSNTNLVIDGHSLCAQIYSSINCFSAFGGDYDKYATHIKIFFKNLKKCNVTSYIIFDGCYEGRKLRTAYSRLRSKIKGAYLLDPITQGNLKIFPYFLRDVFKEVLNEMNIMYTTCEFEADDELAALARYLNCPVLSYDSDFFIYNVQYIPFNTLNKKPVQIIENDSKVHVIECKIYKAQFLTKHFGLNEELLPLLATLLGNDFVEKKIFRKFFSQLKLPKNKKQRNEQQRCIHGLMKWLQYENLESAIAKILGRLKKTQKIKVFDIIKKSIAGYNKKECNSLKYFCFSKDLHEDVLIIKMPLTDDENDAEGSSESSDSSSDEENPEVDIVVVKSLDNNHPSWFVDRIRSKTIPHLYLNLFTHHLFFCNPQAEDYTQEDSFICAVPILRYSFDLMKDFSVDYCIYVSRETDGNYKRLSVDKSFAISQPLDICFADLSTEQLQMCFMHFFNQKMPFDENLLQQMPSGFKVFALSILWWISKCDVTFGHINALLLCYTYLDVIDEKLGGARGHFHFNNKHSAKLKLLKSQQHENINDELMLNKNKVQYDDCLIAASVMLKHFELDDTIRKRPKSYDVKIMHSFAQFQCCLSQLNSLNILCGRPYDSTIYSKSYSGTFIYNIATKLIYEDDPTLFCEKYLSGATSVIMFFKSLNCILKKMIESLNLKVQHFGKQKRKHTRRKKKAIDDELLFLVKGFECDVKI